MTVLLRVLITARTFTTAAMASQLRVKRVTQGKRMTQLIGKAAEEDAEFWGEGNYNHLTNELNLSSLLFILTMTL